MTKYNRNRNKAMTYNLIIGIVESDPDFISNWKLIDDTYRSLGWEDKISDEQRIKEYRKINEYYIKYISTKRPDIIDMLNNNPKKLLSEINEWLGTKIQKPDKTNWSKEFITYNKMKKEWLKYLRSKVREFINKEE